ncbi:MAG: VOC family protein [Alphaproteobacteria bacterium]|nr:MAG: VOC family protein [Alphaproteobacteria bacterium]
MINGIHHVAISTPNMARILQFYKDVLGFEEISRVVWQKGTKPIDRVVGLRDSAAESVMLRAGNAVIEFFEYHAPRAAPKDSEPPANAYGYTHFCLDVTDIDKEYERLKAAGVRFHAPPQDFGTIKATYGRDPDGNIFEIQELLGAEHPLRIVRRAAS